MGFLSWLNVAISALAQVTCEQLMIRAEGSGMGSKGMANPVVC